MAKAAVEAESPYFLVVTAFSVFAWANAEKTVAEVAVHQTHCQRLAKLFSVDAQALACHIARHRPTAQAIKNSTQCNNQEAWQKAVQRIREVRASAGLMLDSLQPVAMRDLVWSCSAAGVEQRFSIGDRLGVDRNPASQTTESLTLRAVFGKVSADERRKLLGESRSFPRRLSQDKEPYTALRAGQGD